MKKIMIKILCGVITFAMAFSIVGCDKTDEMQSKLASLEAQIAKQTQEIKDLQAENEKLQADLAETIVINQTLSNEVQEVEKKFYNSLFSDIFSGMWINYDLSEEQYIPKFDYMFQYVEICVSFKKVITDTYPEYDLQELFDKFRVFAPDKIVDIDAMFSLRSDYPEGLAKNFRQYVVLDLDDTTTVEEACDICRKIMLLDFVYTAVVENPYTEMPEI